MDARTVLSVRDLCVTFPSDAGPVRAVDGMSFEVFGNEVLGVVGESGAGKTMAMLAVLGLLPPRAVASGEVRYGGRDLLRLQERELNELRGDRLAIVERLS